MRRRDLIESLRKVELAIDILSDLEGEEVITGDEILEVIEPSMEKLDELRSRLRRNINSLGEDKYSIKETKEDTFRKMAIGY